MIEDPFVDYPDFGRVLDRMAEKGLHLYYHRVRNVFKDEGSGWRKKWEPRIRIWMQKAWAWDSFTDIFDRGIPSSSSEHPRDIRIPLDDHGLAEVLEKTRRAFQAQEDLRELQNWLLLDAMKNYSPRFVKFVERSLADWRAPRGDKISSPLFEVAPKGTMEQLMQVEQVLEFLESTSPMGKMDGLPVHSSEVLEYARLRLRSILGLPTGLENLWSVRDVRKIHGWAGVGREPGCEGSPEQIPLPRAPNSRLTGPHTP